jgi:hypothetical protein
MSDYQLPKLQVKLVIEEDKDEDEEYHFINFIFELKNVFTSTITIFEPYMCEKKDWNKLYNGKKINMEFCDCNGEVSIISDGTNVNFTVSKAGSGGDGYN